MKLTDENWKIPSYNKENQTRMKWGSENLFDKTATETPKNPRNQRAGRAGGRAKVWTKSLTRINIEVISIFILRCFVWCSDLSRLPFNADFKTFMNDPFVG